MTLCHFIGDELTALGFRLAGADTHTPAEAQIAPLFRSLQGQEGLLILTQSAAAVLPEDELQAAMLAARPMILVIPEASGGAPPVDFAQRLREQLGMSE